MLRIVKKNKAKFCVFDDNHRQSKVDLDFNPFLIYCGFTEGLFIHLRTRPINLICDWSYGVYDVSEDNYFSIQNFLSEGQVNFFTLCCEENTDKPSHVIAFPDSKLKITPETNTGVIYQNLKSSKKV